MSVVHVRIDLALARSCAPMPKRYSSTQNLVSRNFHPLIWAAVGCLFPPYRGACVVFQSRARADATHQGRPGRPCQRNAAVRLTLLAAVLGSCLDTYTTSEWVGQCFPCGPQSDEEIISFYEGICGDLTTTTRIYILSCFGQPPDCPSDSSFTTTTNTDSDDFTTTDDDYSPTDSGDFSTTTTDDDYSPTDSDDFFTTTDDYTTTTVTDDDYSPSDSDDFLTTTDDYSKYYYYYTTTTTTTDSDDYSPSDSDDFLITTGDDYDHHDDHDGPVTVATEPPADGETGATQTNGAARIGCATGLSLAIGAALFSTPLGLMLG